MFLRLFLFDYLLQFCPDLVLVCAGFDSAIGDPEVLKINHSNEVYNAQWVKNQHSISALNAPLLEMCLILRLPWNELSWSMLICFCFLCFQGEMCATPDIFAHLTHLLMNLAGGKLCAVLEVRPRSIRNRHLWLFCIFLPSCWMNIGPLKTWLVWMFSREDTTWLPSRSLCVKRFRHCLAIPHRRLQTSAVPVRGLSHCLCVRPLSWADVCYKCSEFFFFFFQRTWVPSLRPISSQAVLVLPKTRRCGMQRSLHKP